MLPLVFRSTGDCVIGDVICDRAILVICVIGDVVIGDREEEKEMVSSVWFCAGRKCVEAGKVLVT